MRSLLVHPALFLAFLLAACSSSTSSAVDGPSDAETVVPPDAGASCAQGTQLCGNLCVDVTSNAGNCGACGHACGSSEVCAGGVCRSTDCRKVGCAAGLYCDMGTGGCRAGCSSDAQCSSTETCDTANHTCLCKAGFRRCTRTAACTPSADACPQPMCSGMRKLCNGECVDVYTDPRNCGDCGKGCQPAEICRGTCQAAPDCRQDGNTCFGLTWCDQTNGICKPGCTRDDQCDASETCDFVTHKCSCGSGRHHCSGVCLDDTSPQSCGQSCTPCPEDPYGVALCTAGKCIISCNPGYHLCNGACVSDFATATCGASCSACPGDPNGAPTCDGKTCGLSCNAGRHACSGACVTNNDLNHCGSDCTPCPTHPNAVSTCDGTSCGFVFKAGSKLCNGECRTCPNDLAATSFACAADQCVVDQCAGGFHLCNGQCVSNYSPGSCGSSCTPCPGLANGQATCDGASCGTTCNSGYLMCSAACAQCPNDPGANLGCSGGGCAVQSCKSGFHLCGSACANNLSTSSCGASCTPCPTDPNGAATCDGTGCGIACNGGFKLCGGTCAQCPSVGVAQTDCAGSQCLAVKCQAGNHLCGTGCCPWQIETVDSPSAASSGSQESAQVLVDSGGTVRIGYCQIGSGTSQGVWATRGSSSWTRTPFAGGTGCASFGRSVSWVGSGSGGGFTARAVHYGYLNGGTSRGLIFATTSPYAASAVDFFADSGRTSSAVVDSSGVFQIAYNQINGSSTNLRFGVLSGGWQLETVDGGGRAYGPSLALASDGAPHIAYYESTNGPEIRVAIKRSGAWTYHRVEGLQAVNGQTSIAIAADGAIHLLYMDGSTKDVRHASIPVGSATWVTESVGSAYSTSADLWITTDAQSRPHVVFMDANKVVTYGVKTSAGWQLSGIETGTDVGSVALDTSGNPHVAYTIPGTQTILRYAH